MNQSSISSEFYSNPHGPGVRAFFNWLAGVIIKHYLLLVITFAGVAGAGIIYTRIRPAVYVSRATIMLIPVEQTSISPYIPLNPSSMSVQQQYIFLSILNSVLYSKRLAESLNEAGFIPTGDLDVSDAINRQLDFSIQKNNMFVDLDSRAPFAESAFLLVHHAVAVLTERSREIQLEEHSSTLDFLDQQLQVISDQIEEIEREIQEFQEANEMDPGDLDRGVWGKLYDLEKQRSETEIAIAMEQMNYNSYGEKFQNLVTKTTQELGGKDTPQIQVHKAKIEELQKELDNLLVTNPQSPRIDLVRVQLEKVRNDLIAAVSALQATNPKLKQQRISLLETLIEARTNSELTLVSLRNRLLFLKESIRRFRDNHPDILESAITYARLTRSKEVYKNTFNILLEGREETRIQAASETGGIKVIDPPYLPEEPEPSHAVIYLVVSIMLGLFLGTGICYVVEIMDNSIKSADDVRRGLKLSVLGYIPVIRKVADNNHGHVSSELPEDDDNSRQSLLLTSFTPKDPVAEAYRSLKTNILFAYPDEKLDSLVISGPGVGEGKSLTSANLAISFAMSGQRTMLIDCDLRRPIQHKQFRVPRSPGLTDYLVSQADRSDIINITDLDSLSIISSGSSSPNPADLLQSNRMKEFLNWAREEYDIVLLDTPPVNIVVDARVLSKMAQGLLIVLETEKTKMDAAQMCVEQVHQTNGKILGAVMNKINVHRLYAHYYHSKCYDDYTYTGKYHNQADSD